jgi:predicted alpha/beta superfamily hydrolase
MIGLSVAAALVCGGHVDCVGAQPPATPMAQQPAPQDGQPIEIGRSFKVHSSSLGEERVVNVHLPPGYGSGEKRYPVLYLIDGGVDQDFPHVTGTAQLGALWGRSQEVIVVGVATKDRRRELVGPTRDPDLLTRYPTAGQSAAFRRFIRSEVMPVVEARYRTNGTTGVLGESLAGLFIVETFLREPDLFDHYAAISPSLWWDKERLSLEAGRLIGASHSDKRLYVATANEGSDMKPAVDRLLTALRPVGELCYVPRDDLTHATIYHAVSPQALQFLFPPAEKPDPQMGFELTCSPRS